MNKLILYLFIFLFLSNCSFNKDDEQNKNYNYLFNKVKPIEKELNPLLPQDIYSTGPDIGAFLFLGSHVMLLLNPARE